MTVNKDIYEIHLPQFEGPFDLLLFFIERDELDIYDIPIAKITEDFLDYLRRMNEMNIEMAGEFILVAATLMRIKAKMLLPRPDLNEEGVEIDPRQDLVERLLEYKRYKDVSQTLADMESERAMKFKRGHVRYDLQRLIDHNSAEEELHNLDLYRLFKAFKQVMERFDREHDDTRHHIQRYPYTVEEQKEQILHLLNMNKEIDFSTIVTSCKDRVQVIYSFLGILEMLQQQILSIRIGLGYNNFHITRKAS